MERFRNLDVWVHSVDLARSIYRLTMRFPSGERFGMTSRLRRRAAVSVPSNIAEGSVRKSRHEFRRYAEIALGSLAEIETQLEIAADFLVPRDQLTDVHATMLRVRQMLYRLMASLESSRRGI